MKLIDVNKVDIPIMQRRGDAWVFRCNFKEVLDTLPTVEAIPIEWIDKYIDNRLVKHGDTWTFINCMINDWKNKNERDV